MKLVIREEGLSDALYSISEYLKTGLNSKSKSVKDEYICKALGGVNAIYTLTDTIEEEEKTEVLGVCKQCGRMIKKGEEKFATPYILCKSCDARNKAEETQKQNAEKKRREAHESMKRAARRRYRNWGLFWGILAAVAIIVIMAVSIKNVGVAIGTAIGAGIFTFTFVSQLYWGGAVRDVAECGGKIIGTPGVIFTFDLDGFIFLIGIKILFAVIRFLVWLITVLFFGLIAFIISPVTFIPRFIKLLAGIEVDEIYDEKTGTII